jgi:ATP phosphoribosyltransferase
MSANTQARGYTLPLSLIDRISEMPKNRSALVADAVKAAHKDPSRLIAALRRRIATPTAAERTARVTVSATNEVITKLTDLTGRFQLGTEHVLRLALEDHLHET